MLSKQSIFKKDKKAEPIKTHHILTTANLRGLSTPSPSTAWASGQNGTVIRTIDNGETWECKQIPTAEKYDFRDIKAFDASTAYVMSAGEGEASRIYKTTNGGKSWSLQLKGTIAAEFFNSMAFWDRDNGIVLSDQVAGKFKIYLTEDGGSHWNPIPESAMPVALKGEGAFAASGSCIAVQGQQEAWFVTGVNAARVFRTDDKGKTWQAINTPIIQDSPTAGIYSIAFYDSKHGVICGGDYKKPDKGGANLATTEDGGITWKLAKVSPQYYWSAVSFTPDHTNIMVVGPKHAGLTSNEPTTLWEQSWNINLNALSFWSRNKALAVGEKGSIVEFEIKKTLG